MVSMQVTDQAGTDADVIQLGHLDLVPIPSAVGLSRRNAPQWQQMLQETAAEADPANLCMRLYYQMMGLGDVDLALAMQQSALSHRTLFRLEGAGRPRLRLLVFMGPGGMADNTPIDFLLEGADVELTLLYVLPEGPLPELIPDHDLAFVALGASRKNEACLSRIGRLVRQWPRPVLNRPDAMVNCQRHVLWRLALGIPGLMLPQTLCQPREQIEPSAWPCTIRPLDTQGGVGLARIGDSAALAAYLDEHPEPAFHVARYCDCRGPDGLYRKYRVAVIAGRPFACHLAISSHWMVHYYSAPMLESEALRAEEARFMADFDHDFGLRHGASLAELSRRIGLDYLVLDCAEMADGRLLVFEADGQGWIHDTDPVEVFPYKSAVMQKAFAAFRDLLFQTAAAGRAD